MSKKSNHSASDALGGKLVGDFERITSKQEADFPMADDSEIDGDKPVNATDPLQ